MLGGGVAACHGYGMCTVRCVECDRMVCVLFAVLSVKYGMCTVLCVECDRMVCVLCSVLSVTVWCVYCALC